MDKDLLRDIRHIECVFPDVGGIPRGKLVRAAAIEAGHTPLMAQAVLLQTVNGGYADDRVVGETDSDARLIPDWNTLRRLPWAPDSAWLVHDCADKNGELIAYAPRSVLKSVLARYAAKGWKPVVAPEIEFYLFALDSPIESGFDLPRESASGAAVRPSAYGVESRHMLAAFWDELFASFEALQIPCDTWLHEMGPSQFEINLLHGDALAAADQTLLFRTTLRQVAARHRLAAVFMAKPLAGEAGSAMHLHQSVVSHGGDNIFSRADGSATAAFEHFIGGLQRYLPEMLPIFAPYINSWRRYVVSASAPMRLDWGDDNRTVALRSPAASPEARRIENRVAGSDANPYLVIAASLACGLAGIEEKIPARAAVSDISGYNHEPEITGGLEASVARLKSSEAARRLLGEVFVEGFCSVKEIEIADFMGEITPWERRLLGLQL